MGKRKINTHLKIGAFLYINNYEFENNEENNCIYYIIKNDKILDNKLNEGGENTCTQKSKKALVKKIEEDTNKWKSHAHGLEGLIAKYCENVHIPKVICKVNATTDKMSMVFIVEIEKRI